MGLNLPHSMDRMKGLDKPKTLIILWQEQWKEILCQLDKLQTVRNLNTLITKVNI
jgi:hypothetical protein